MKKATDKQKNLISVLLRKTRDPRVVDLESLSKGQAGKLIAELLEKKSTPPQPAAQADLRLPEPEPPGELTEFKRWARGAYQRGEKTIFELIDLQRERFGNPFAP